MLVKNNLKKPIKKTKDENKQYNENFFNINIKGKIILQNENSNDFKYLRFDICKNPYILIETLDKQIILSYVEKKIIDYLNNNKNLINKENIFRGQLITYQDIYDNNINRLVFNKLIGIDNDSEETKEFKLIVNCFKVFDNITDNYNQDNFLLVKLKKYNKNLELNEKLTLKLSYEKLNVPVNNNGHPDLISTANRYLPLKVTLERNKSSFQIINIDFLNY